MNAESFAALASVVVAVAALAFSIISFQRQQARAEKQQARAEKLTVDSVKPLLWIQSEEYVDLKSIRLRNYGMGPAIIKSARFEKDGQHPTERIVELFMRLNTERLPAGRIRWATFAALPTKRVIPAQGEVPLLRLTFESLENQGVEGRDGLQLLEQFDNEKKGIKARIEYKDIFGNEMEPLEHTFN